ncbi:MAG TPA: hydroxymethylbilane synthase [Acetobacteraceae bacterium]|jgi:hydroxymethylbilane synthase|nr:hydroxymethylbilane synthase [Acetobacteraceae bacterium]
MLNANTAQLDPHPDHSERRSSTVRPHTRPLPLRVGTRSSPLALVQTRAFLETLTKFCPVLRGMEVFEEHAIRTTGDATQASGTRLADIGGKGLFAKEIHEALLDRRIDFAVHSLKDLETELPSGIALACTLRREDPRDALVLGPECLGVDPADPLAALPPAALIGSSSVRRQAQLLHMRPDLHFAVLRGNVQLRLARVQRGDFTASLLATAGLQRLGLEDQGVALDPETMVPAAGQGIVGITVRTVDTELRELLAAIEDPVAKAVSTAERALLAALDGSCRTPIGGYARLDPDGSLHLTGLVARANGSFLLRRTLRGSGADAARIGAELGASLRSDSPADIFA